MHLDFAKGYAAGTPPAQCEPPLPILCPPPHCAALCCAAGFFLFWRDFRYSPEFAREYLESVRPDLAIGEFWTDCNYSGEEGEEHELDYDQGAGAGGF